MTEKYSLLPTPPDPQPRVRMVVDPKNLPRQLKAIRQEQDKALVNMSDNMPVAHRTMCRFESGETDARLLHLVEWVNLLGYELALVYPSSNT